MSPSKENSEFQGKSRSPTWDHTARHYDSAVSLSSRTCAPRLIALASSLRSLDVPTAKAAEFGAGTGSLTLELAKRHSSLPIIATDISGPMLSELRAAAAGFSNVSTQVADMTDPGTAPSLSEGGFSHIFSTMAIQAVSSPGDALAKWRDLLEPGGVVAIAIWALDNGCGPHAIWNRAATRADSTYIPPVWVPPERWPSLADLERGVRGAGFKEVTAEMLRVGFDFGLEALMDFYWESKNPMCEKMKETFGDRDLSKVKVEMEKVIREDFENGWKVPLDAGLVVGRK